MSEAEEDRKINENVAIPEDVEGTIHHKKRKFNDQQLLPDEVVDQSAFSRLLEPVVKIFTVTTEPDYSMPWQMKKQKRSTSSGFVISDRRIITNAHAIANQTSIMVRKHGDAKRYIAKVLAVGHECDLALLGVEDDSFWSGLTILEFGGIPHLQEAVTVVGYPTGGDNISVTTGVVSRVDITTYAHSSCKLLAIQIDAAINPGNSGGPTFQNGKFCGIAFETMADAENIGYIIPVPIILHFLEDIKKNGRYTGFCDLGLSCQSMENNQLKEYVNIPLKETGILVNRIDPLSSSAQLLSKFDVILSFDGVTIADDGTVPFRNGERISFRYLFMNKFVGDTCNITVLRKGIRHQLELTMGLPTYLVPIIGYDTLPSYFVTAGFLFVPLTRSYMRHQWGKQWDRKAPIKLCDKAMNEQKLFPDQEIVILAQVLAAEINIGYQNLSNIQVFSVNDEPVKNLKHLLSLIESCTATHLKIDLEFSRTIILNTAKTKAATPDILRQHNISFDKSLDLRISATQQQPTTQFNNISQQEQ
jgi:S1-C subfamily serine protease